MKVRSFICAAVLLILLALSSTGVLASESNSNIVSFGRVVYTNGTPDNINDDVIIYDSDDLTTMNNKITAFEKRLSAAKTRLR